MLKLNRRGILARFYVFWGATPLPNDLCTFWWGLVGRALKVAIASFALLGIASMVVWALYTVILSGWRHPQIAGLVIAGSAILSLVIWKRKAFQFELAREAKAVVQARIHATKARFCPQIDWQE